MAFDLVNYSLNYKVQSKTIDPSISLKARVSLQQKYLVFHARGQKVWIVDFNNFAILHTFSVPDAIAAAFFQPLETLSNPDDRKRLILLKKDSLSLYWTHENKSTGIRPSAISGYSLFDSLLVGRLQNIYFAGENSRGVSLFHLDHRNPKNTQLIISNIHKPREHSSITLAEFNNTHVILCVDFCVHIINVALKIIVKSFILLFVPSSCHVFHERVLSFYNPRDNTLHSFLYSLSGDPQPYSTRLLTSHEPLDNTQCLSIGGERLFTWSPSSQFFTMFVPKTHIFMSLMNQRTGETRELPYIESLKEMCWSVMQKANSVRITSQRTRRGREDAHHLSQYVFRTKAPFPDLYSRSGTNPKFFPYLASPYREDEEDQLVVQPSNPDPMNIPLAEQQNLQEITDYIEARDDEIDTSPLTPFVVKVVTPMHTPVPSTPLGMETSLYPITSTTSDDHFIETFFNGKGQLSTLLQEQQYSSSPVFPDESYDPPQPLDLEQELKKAQTQFNNIENRNANKETRVLSADEMRSAFEEIIKGQSPKISRQFITN